MFARFRLCNKPVTCICFDIRPTTSLVDLSMILTARLRMLLISVLALSLNACGPGGSTPEPEVKNARNVILFVGDGMGISTVTAARIFDGQSQGKTGEEHSLAFDDFPHVALVKTYNTNQQVADSAGTATAMMTGSKTRAGVINVGPDVNRRSCSETAESALVPLSRTAKERGKSAGFVTTTRVTHATPATTYASISERDWEADTFMSEDVWTECPDIAYQLVNMNVDTGLDVAMGGGRGCLLRPQRGRSSQRPQRRSRCNLASCRRPAALRRNSGRTGDIAGRRSGPWSILTFTPQLCRGGKRTIPLSRRSRR